MNKPAILILVLLIIGSCKSEENHYRTWKVYQGDPGSNSYSELDQINRENVDQLEVSWTYNSGDKDLKKWKKSTSQANPIIIDGIMYFTSPALRTTAVDARTGERVWVFDPFENDDPQGVNRGVVYWENENDKRILFTAGPNLYALNAENGSVISDFGDNGSVDLREGLGRNPDDLYVVASSPGIVYEDLIIMGSSVGEGKNAAPGHIRAYNVQTGEMEWIFHTIPHPGEFGHETWDDPDAWQKIGGVNNWAGMSLDEKRGMVFIPTGSASSDFYGGIRKGANLFANTILALDASTGERIWHYQTLRHDLWDYDLPAPPNLVTVKKNGKSIDAVAQVTKQGFTFLLDRETGKPLFPVEERPVLKSEIEGEESWPTQLFPAHPVPFTRQEITDEDITDISAGAREYALKQFRELNYKGLFTPVSEQKTLFYPGTQGGAEWGGAAFDSETSLLYINANEFGNSFSLKKIKRKPVRTEKELGERVFQSNCAVCHGSSGNESSSEFPSLEDIDQRLSQEEVNDMIRTGRGRMPGFPQLSEEDRQAIVAYIFNLQEQEGEMFREDSEKQAAENFTYDYTVDTAYQTFTDQDGYPATKPPWGSLNAINLNSGEIIWKVPLGEYPELTEQGIPPTGTHNLGGPVVTAGGLVFIAATRDEKFRAFDKLTGEILWEYKLPAGGYATPSTYEIDGKQYVVIAATGGGNIGTETSDAFIAFSLPDGGYH